MSRSARQLYGRVPEYDSQKTQGASATPSRIAFDARLVGALGIGRYISGLLPPLAAHLEDNLTIFISPQNAALLRAQVGRAPRIVTVKAKPYRLAEQSVLLLGLTLAGLPLVHFPHYNLPLAFRRPFVVTIHDLFSFEFPEIHSSALARSVNHLLIRNAVLGAKAIITPSGSTTMSIKRRFPSAGSKITSIPEAADRPFSPVRSLSAEASWQKYFAIRPPYILYLGQWKAYKNVPLLIEAFARASTRVPGLQLVIGGQDPRHPEVKALAARLPSGSIVFPGHVPEDALPELYRGATAVVLPSRAEGFGLPALEAMACGVPLVCSDIPAFREIADGVAVFSAEGDAEQLAGAIVEASRRGPDHPSRMLGIERARQFSWERAAVETLRIYERVLGS